MDDHNQTIRQAVIEAAGQFDRIDAAVFTTFNFSPVFFENNILPALFGFEGASEGVRRTMVNLKLAETDVCVFYDASTRPKDSGIYRYQSAGLVLPKRFFHPKMIIMAGTGVQDGAMQVYLAVMSANMSMAGWGKNAEVYADMWLDGADQINCSELISAIEWLGQRFQGIGSARIPALSRILKGIGQLSKAKSLQDDQGAYFYFSPMHPKGFFHFITQQSGVSQWEELMVFSPYWSDLPANIQKAGAHQATLVPAFIPSNKSYGLGKQQLEDLAHVNLMRLAKGDDIRLWHAKAYEFQSKTDRWVASGSSNFTFNGLAGGEAGNVEAMLVRNYPLRGRGDHFPELIDLEDRDKLPDDNLNEDAPEPLVFDITVSYDWLMKTYAIEFAKPENGSCSNFTIYLPGSDKGFSLSHEGQGPVIIQAVGPLKSKLFRLHYDERGQEQVFEGLILELNLDHSPKRYTRQLSWLEILENWQRHPDDPSILIPFEDLEDTLADDTPLCIAGGNGAQEGKLEEDEDIDVLNFYDMYRNFFEYRAGLLEAVEANDTRRLEQLIIKRPDSVYKLAGEAYTAQGHPVPRFIVLQECCLLLDACRGLTIDGVDKCVADTREWALELRGNVCDKLKETEAKMVPDELLDWFEEESMKAWQG